MTGEVQYSSSVVDVETILHGISTFWKDLDWPDNEEAFGYVLHLLKVITDERL